MLHIYCGDGKGKTTAAMGLAIRAAGHGRKVVVAQFLKGDNSGERVILSAQPNIQCLPVPEAMKFTFAMTEEEKDRTWQETADSFDLAARLGRQADLLVLDEACALSPPGCCLWTGCWTFWTAARRSWRWSSLAGTPTRSCWSGPTM